MPVNMENPTTVRKIQIFFYCVRKTLLVNYFRKYTFKVPVSSHFLKTRKVRNTAQSTKMADGIYPKLYIFNTPVQKIWFIQNEAISLVAMRSKELWLVEKNCATVKPDSRVAPRWMKTYSESKKSTNLEENAGKIKSVFATGAALWAEKLGHCLENYRSWKNTLGKVVVTVKLEAIWFEFWMKGA